MLADDRRLSLRMIAEELTISLDSVSNIIHEHLQKRKKKVYRHCADVTTVLRGIPKESFADSFQQLYNRCQKCIVANEDRRVSDQDEPRCSEPGPRDWCERRRPARSSHRGSLHRKPTHHWFKRTRFMYLFFFPKFYLDCLVVMQCKGY
ncbi:hypothetical protein AVEN_80877-1 [Araneus ventricosus]|uniref:Mos1 transposase HTH domain-containing protein n=1 Tax=Araneus ventricosus TaxID=182803 RepID=A0A4Y2V787_ARAVE|nr:hypothetical protein AVEN_80877-1 [Araneus ventricosus]